MNDAPRFEFGENWQRFLEVLDEDRIAEAERSLVEALGTDALSGKSFLDVGCGSGLFSLAALRLGATRVHSLGYDPASVACATESAIASAIRTAAGRLSAGIFSIRAM